ncbi:hypothetical protein IAT40_005077 [Kwoniella sp. CBS 6097]
MTYPAYRAEALSPVLRRRPVYGRRQAHANTQTLGAGENTTRRASVYRCDQVDTLAISVPERDSVSASVPRDRSGPEPVGLPPYKCDQLPSESWDHDAAVYEAWDSDRDTEEAILAQELRDEMMPSLAWHEGEDSSWTGCSELPVSVSLSASPRETQTRESPSIVELDHPVENEWDEAERGWEVIHSDERPATLQALHSEVEGTSIALEAEDKYDTSSVISDIDIGEPKYPTQSVYPRNEKSLGSVSTLTVPISVADLAQVCNWYPSLTVTEVFRHLWYCTYGFPEASKPIKNTEEEDREWYWSV